MYTEWEILIVFSYSSKPVDFRAIRAIGEKLVFKMSAEAHQFAIF